MPIPGSDWLLRRPSSSRWTGTDASPRSPMTFAPCSRVLRRSSLLAVVVVLAGCASRGVAVVGSPAAEVPLRARLLRMTDTRTFDSALVEDALTRGAPATRAAAALAIGQVRARAGAPRLRALLADPDTAVAANAAYALGLIRDT